MTERTYGCPGAHRTRCRSAAKLLRRMTTDEGHGRTWLLVAVAGLVAVVLAGVGVATTAGRDVVANWVKVPEGTSAAPRIGPGSASATPGLPSSYTVPGTPPQLPWPAAGQASVEVSGAGSLGATPSQHPVPIASLTKVMTAFVVLRDHPLSATDSGPTLTVTASEAAAYPAEVAKNESLVPVDAGEVLTERQALQALLLPSADNIARILARWDAGDVAAFLAKMNTTATSLGMVNTRYTDPSGYDAATRSTAADQVTLGDRAMKMPAIAQIVAMPTATIPVAGIVHNLNTALGQDGIVGVKTGSTRAAGGCLLFAARHTVDSRTVTIIGAVLGQQGAAMYGLPQALTTAQRLVQVITSAAHVYTAIRAGQTVATINGIDLVASRTLAVLGWPGLSYPVTIRTKDGPANGAIAGTLELDSPDGPQTTTLTARR